MNQVVHVIPNFKYFEPFKRGKWIISSSDVGEGKTEEEMINQIGKASYINMRNNMHNFGFRELNLQCMFDYRHAVFPATIETD